MYADILGKSEIAQVQISIDGPKRIHDKRRIHRGRESSFDAIERNLDQLIPQSDAEFQLRVHVDPDNIDLFEETMRFFEGKGWLDHENVVVYANTVYEKNGKGQVSSRFDHGEIEARLDDLIGQRSNVFPSAPTVNARRMISRTLNSNLPYRLRGNYCAANTGNYIFAPDGHVYACWESLGKSCSRIGTYDSDEGLQLDDRQIEKWFGRSVAEIDACMNCSYALICGGGCAQFAEYNHGHQNNPYCDDLQSVFPKALRDEVDDFLNRYSREAGSAEVISVRE